MPLNLPNLATTTTHAAKPGHLLAVPRSDGLQFAIRADQFLISLTPVSTRPGPYAVNPTTNVHALDLGTDWRVDIDPVAPSFGFPSALSMAGAVIIAGDRQLMLYRHGVDGGIADSAYLDLGSCETVLRITPELSPWTAGEHSAFFPSWNLTLGIPGERERTSVLRWALPDQAG